MATKNLCAVPGIIFVQGKFGTQGGEDVATPRMPDPARDIFFHESGSVENRAGVLGG
jgi:hypothetical protein